MGDRVDWSSLFSWSPKNYRTLAAQWLPLFPLIYFTDNIGLKMAAIFMICALPVQIMRIRRNAAAIPEQADSRQDA
jgi:hypothetical protein